MRRNTSRKTSAVARRPRVLPLALALGMSTVHATSVSAQTVAHANDVALAAIAAIANMASQSADKAHAAEVMQAAIAAVTTIATTTIQAQVQAQTAVETARLAAGSNAAGAVSDAALPALAHSPVPGPVHNPPAAPAEVMVLKAAPVPSVDAPAALGEAQESLPPPSLPAPLPPAGEGSLVAAPVATVEVVPVAQAMAAASAAAEPAPEAAIAVPAAAVERLPEHVPALPPPTPIPTTPPLPVSTEQRAPSAAPTPLPMAELPAASVQTVEVQTVEVPATPAHVPPPSPPTPLPQVGEGRATAEVQTVEVRTIQAPVVATDDPAPMQALEAVPVPAAPQVVVAEPVASEPGDIALALPDIEIEAIEIEPLIEPLIEPVADPLASVPRRAPANGAVSFNPNLLHFPVDPALFAEGNPVLPGTYRLDVSINERWQGKFDVRFENLSEDARVAQPCIDAALLEALGVNPAHLNPDYAAALAAGEAVCGPLELLIPGASHQVDVGAQSLAVSVPQIAMLRQARGYVDPARWDAGINAATLGYYYNGWHSKQTGLSTTSHYLGLRAGVNLGSWRFRYRATLTHGNDLGLQYRNDAVYVERALAKLASRLTLGEASTSNRVFEAIGYRGFSLESDERMQPDSRSGFAPVIRGIAQSNARVTIHQRGSQIFETTVPPGPFEIDDLYPNGSGGDLLVTITEADGSTRQFTETYASLPELLRPGVIRYSVAGGRYRDNGDDDNAPWFGQGTVSVGLSNTVTAYGGLLFAQGYDAAAGGLGLNLPIGAVTLDGMYSRTFLPGATVTGTGWRLAYTATVERTQTDVRLAMLRYANEGFYEPREAFDLMARIRRGQAPALNQRRAQLSLSVNQPLPGRWGALSFSGSVQTYWDRPGRDIQYHLGYGRSIGRVSATLTATRTRNTVVGRWDNQYLLNLSVPLGSGSGSSNRAYLSGSYARRRDGQSAQTSVSGTLGEHGLVSYSVFGAADKARQGSAMTNGGGSVGWVTPVARMSVSASAGSRGSQQYGFNASGGVVAFRDAVLATPELGETVGIVQARHARGAVVSGATRSLVNASGHALVASLQPYRENDVSVDPKGLSTDVELLDTNQKVAPTEGAVVLLKYQTRYGYSVLILGRREDGSTLPFAAGVFDGEGNNVGYTGQGGQALVRLAAAQGQLQVRWGAKPEEQCAFDYDLGDEADSRAGADAALRQVEVRCL